MAFFSLILLFGPLSCLLGLEQVGLELFSGGLILGGKT